MLLPYLNPIVKCLLKLLNPAGDPALVRRYVQEQAITTLAMVADANEVTFAKVIKHRCGGKGRRTCWGSNNASYLLFFLPLSDDYAVAVERAVECGWARLLEVEG